MQRATPAARRLLAGLVAAAAAIAAGSLAGCARPSEPAASGAGSGAEPAAIEPQPFALPDGSLRASVAARVIGVEAAGDGTGDFTGRFDLGGPAPAVCRFSAQPEVLGLPAHALVGAVVGTLRDLPPGEPPEIVSRVRAGAVGNAPFLSLDVAVRRGDLLALLQQRIASKDGRAVLCALPLPHEERALDRFFFGMIETLALAAPPEPPLYGSVSTLHVDGEPTGFASITLARDGSDVLRFERRTSMLFPARDGGVVPVDALEHERTRADGRVLDAGSERTEAFSPQMRLALEPAGGRAFRVHGTLRDTPIDERFSTPAAGPTSYLRHLWNVRDAARRRRTGVPIRELHWAPELSVGSLSEVVIELAETETGALRARERTGTQIYDYAIDAAGMPDSGSALIGPRRAEQRVEVSFGEVPPAPGEATR